MEKVKVFVDTNLLVSALISQKGASYEIVQNSNIVKIISPTVSKELTEVSKKFRFRNKDVETILKHLSLKKVSLKKEKLEEIYSGYVMDTKDTHVLSSAKESKTKFLLTHNIKHFRVEKINNDFGIIVIKPGNFLQYLRSQE